MIGQKLKDRYEVTTRLGKGAMGTVYRAVDTQRGRQVAVKVISSELAVDPAMLERFKREGEALRQLRHVNIVGFIDAFQQGELSIIVMEHVSGGSLYDLIKKGRLPIENAVQIALDLCDALIRAHRLKIIHRDIKPENILIDEDGTPKLADFGVARLSEGTRMTHSGVQVGTPYYMSPEAWEGRSLDAQADIWSLGVVLFEILTGQVPFGGDTPLAVMSRINTMPPPDLKRLRSDVPGGLAKITSRMLTRNKKRRYQTMREVAVDLEREQERLYREKRSGIELLFQQLAANLTQLMQNFKDGLSTLGLALTRLFFKSKTALRKVHPYIWVGASLSLVLALAMVFFLSRRSPVTSGLPPPTASEEGSVVFSTATSSGEIKFYLYDVATGKFSVIDTGDGTNWDPVLSSSGNIYFTSNRDGKAEIYRRFPDGKVERVTHTDGEFQSWGAAPSIGGNIYFTSNREDNKAEIYRARLVDGKWIYERVTHTDGEFESWGAAPSIGGNIYFTSNREDNKVEIYRRLIGGGIERVTHTDGEFESWGAAPSPGGNLYFTSNREDDKAEIYRRLLDGGIERVTLTDENWGPIFYGRNVYFTSNRSTRNEVYLLDPPIKILDIESWTNYSDADHLDERTPVH
jgi:serine/threonine protein kinase